MHESDEMFSKMVARYGLKHFEKKKEKDFLKFITKEKVKPQQSYQDQQKPINIPDLNSLDINQAYQIKRDPSKMLETYQPKYVEQFWYKYWETNRLFHADAQKALKTDKRYIMVLPPPNVTGYLHLGHALTAAIEDSLIRIHRMRGYETCYLPGMDHAGIGTQTIVERYLQKQGISKWELGREKFLEKVWEWKEKHGTQILHQLRMVGSSLDWDRFHFTMDDQLQKGVTEAFVLMYERGKIYRANRLVNWSCILKTAISDIEVMYEDIKEPKKFPVPGHKDLVEFGWLTYFAYKVKGTNEEIVIATTRLETMLGDVAIAVNSQDPRYKHLIGKVCEHPFIKDREVKIIVDDALVDMNFGTGAVKVTPAHDPNDYECGMRNKLDFISVFDEDGKINEFGGQYQGMMRFDCRKQMEEDMKKMGIYRDRKPNPMRLGFCQRSKDVIEPMIKPQWYMKCVDMKQKMIDVVKTGELKLVPQEFENDWYRWMDGLRDWCISRQLWWGHRCPAYLVNLKGKKGDRTKQDDWIVARSYEEALEKASQKYGLAKTEFTLQQDDDVLDTWFSSALFPFSTFGWPDVENPDFQAFFPNTILETGWDILFFWVARMVQFSLELFGKVPFKHVFLHPIIRDKEGKKMSKSLGNVIDPLEIIEGTTLEVLKQKILEGNLPKSEMERSLALKDIEFPQGIPECGADALRFGLLAYMQRTANINLDVKQIIGYRQFCNKIWQSCRFALPKIPSDLVYTKLNVKDLSLINAWILGRLNQTITVVNQSFDDYEFASATQKFHNFWLYDLCSVYLEAIKNILSDKNQNENLKKETQITLMTCFEQGFRLLHPMMPYLSEELWQKLPVHPGKAHAICIAEFPTPVAEWNNKEVEDQFETIQQICRIARQIVSDAKLPPNARPEGFALIHQDQALVTLIEQQQDIITLLARINSLTPIAEIGEKQKFCGIGNVKASLKIYINLKENIDIDKESDRLNKRLNELIKYIGGINDKIAKYSDKVPESVRKQDNDKMEKYQQEKKVIEDQLEKLKQMKN